MDELGKFLSNFITKKGSNFTHTSIEPRRSYYILESDIKEFYEKYGKAIDEGCIPSITEKPKEIFPILIDLDFRFEGNEHTLRQYDHNMIVSIVSEYILILDKYVEIENDFNIYVMERPEPRYDNKSGYVKDGVHIVIPGIVTSSEVQMLIRKDSLDMIQSIIKDIGNVTSIEDVFDEAVIGKNNWLMYGSSKPGIEPYKVSFILHKKVGDNELKRKEDEDERVMLESEIAIELSIRNKPIGSKIKKDINEKIDELKKKKRIKDKIVSEKKRVFDRTYENIDHVKNLVTILSDARANNFNDWMRVGWCLRNIDNNLLDVWKEFSSKSDKYNESECEDLWSHMISGTLGIGSLHMWAKSDNEEEYKKIVTNNIDNLLMRSLTTYDYDIATVIHFMFQHEYRCSDISKKKWFHFKNHRWWRCDNAYSLHNELSTSVFKEYTKASARCSANAAQTDNSELQVQLNNQASIYSKIAGFLKKNRCKETFIKECSARFKDDKFEFRLNSNPKILCFTNGVFDFEFLEFREGRPEDMCDFCTNIEYHPLDMNDKYIEEINQYFYEVFTDENVRQYMWMFLADTLDGVTRNAHFHIWTGEGANGKSTTIDLLEKVLGDYACKFNVSMLMSKRVGSNQTNSELVRAKGKRFAVLQEPQEDEKMNIGIMKELSGGDTIIARGLFEDPVEFKPQFKMVLTCNHLPKIQTNDKGTWRRIRLVEFTSKFTSDPDINNPKEFIVDTNLSERFENWKETFISMLIEKYKEYVSLGMVISEPDAVMKCTKNYMQSNDQLLEFFSDCIQETGDNTDRIRLTDIFDHYKSWFNNEGFQSKMMKKKDIKTYLEKNVYVFAPNTSNTNPEIMGYKIIDDQGHP
jgi:P4 family phage/plasmid primase-like protien